MEARNGFLAFADGFMCFSKRQPIGSNHAESFRQVFPFSRWVYDNAWELEPPFRVGHEIHDIPSTSPTPLDTIHDNVGAVTGDFQKSANRIERIPVVVIG
jgi:hypothetical protein